MKETINNLDKLMKEGLAYLAGSSEAQLNHKPSPEKWSKKEIIGHLIDSGINNLQRFTEIQYMDQPYQIIGYKQDELVKANDYQNSDTQEIAALWSAINQRISHLMEIQTPETLKYKILMYDDQTTDLEFLMKDYVDHIKHHLAQIKNQ